MNVQPKSILVFDTIQQSWAMVKGTKASFWGAIAILILIGIAFGIVGALTQNVPLFNDGIGLLHSVVQYLLQAGIVYIAIKHVNGEAVTFNLMFRALDFDVMIRLIGLYLLQLIIFLPLFTIAFAAGMMVVDNTNQVVVFISGIIGFIVAIISIYILVRISLAQLFVLDRCDGPWQAIKYSFAATRGNFWRIFAIRFLLTLILVVSALPFGLGLIWTVPLALICVALMYKILLPNVTAA